MAKLLTAHPRVFCDPQENLGFHYGFHFMYLADFPELLYGKIEKEMRHKTWNLIKEGLVATLVKKCNKFSVSKIGDKTPDQDIKRILQTFPEAQVLVMLRDFRDVCVSLAFHAARLSGNWKGYFETPEKTFIDNQFLTVVLEFYETIHDFDEYATHAQEKPCQVKFVKYEDLKAHPFATLKETFDFLGVSSKDATVKESLDLNAFERAARGRRPGQSDAKSFLRKGIVGDWRNHFSKTNIETFKKIAGQTLVKAGYEENNDWE